MTCKLETLCAEDGTKVNVVVNPDWSVEHRLAASQSQLWTGDIDTLAACVCASCDPIQLETTIAPENLRACTVDSVSLDLTAEYAGNFEEGYAYISGGSVVPLLLGGNLTVPIPAAPAGSILIMHVTSGSDKDLGVVGDSDLGVVTISDPSDLSIVGPPNSIDQYMSNMEHNTQIVVFDNLQAGGGATITLGAPNPAPEQNDTQGVINGKWIIITAADSATSTAVPITQSIIDTANFVEYEYAGGVTASIPDTSDPLASPTNCPMLVLSQARHVRHLDSPTGAAQNFMVDADWTQHSAGTELYDTSSQGHRFDNTPCQLGQAAAWIPPNTTFTIDYASNNSSGNPVPERYRTLGLPFLCEQTLCIPDGPGAETTHPFSSPDCERAVTKTISGTGLAFTVGAGESVRLVPIINGTDSVSDAILVDNSAGAAVLNESRDLNIVVNLPNVAAGGSGDCDVRFRLDVVSGQGDGSSVDIPELSVTIDLTEA